MRLGMNIGTPTKPGWWEMQYDLKYRDLAAVSGPWQRLDGNTQPPGGILPPAGSVLTTLGLSYLRPGTYALSCKGTGKIRLTHVDQSDGPNGYRDFAFPVAPSPAPSPTPQAAPSAPDAYLIDIPNPVASPWMTATILTNAPNDPLRDLSLLTPGAGPGPGIWHPDYLASLRPFAGAALRGMDWIGVNASPVRAWADRDAAPGRGPQGFVDLCQALRANPWINLPHLCASIADDGTPVVTDYPAKLGAYIKATLDPSAVVYVAYSNECWNGNPPFSVQLNYCISQGNNRLKDPTTGKPYGVLNGQAAAYVVMGNAAFDALEAAIGPDGPRVVRVLEGQSSYLNSDGSLGGFNYYMLDAARKFGTRVDAIACAPYADWLSDGVNPYTRAAIKALAKSGDPASAIGLLYAGMQGQIGKAITYCQAWRKTADSLGVPLLYYECSPVASSFYTDPDLAPVMQAAATDPRTATHYRQYLEGIGAYAATGCFYSHCRPGPWGLLQDLDDATSRRWEGVTDYAARWNA